MRKPSVVVLVCTALMLVACGGNTAQSTSGTPSLTVTVEASEFKFTPARIELKAGQPIKITFRNKGTVEHDFSVAKIQVRSSSASRSSSAGHDMSNMTTKPDLHVSAEVGGTGTLEFTPAQSGTYEFFCTVAGHKEAGMMGSLVIN